MGRLHRTGSATSSGYLHTLGMLSLLVVLSGCAAIEDPQERVQHATALADARQWKAVTLQTGTLPLIAYMPPQFEPGYPLTVYIEGDGFAWINRSTPSSDPTPRDPIALRMALADETPNVVYLGRACQYVNAEQTGCRPTYWTQGRFSEPVIAASDQAVSQLRQLSGASEITLVGFSGGAAVAALVAQRRDDINALVTVAGNLDHRAWTQYHRVLPLNTSLNPSDGAQLVREVPQLHWVGADDRVIPPALAQRWSSAFLGAENRQLVVVPGFTHTCCWAQQWGELNRQIPGRSRNPG